MSDNVHWPEAFNVKRRVDPPGEPPDFGKMEARLAKLEATVPTLATKADVAELRSDFHKGVNDLIKWIVGTAFVAIAMFITLMTFVLNNASPKAQSVAPTPAAPIVIQLPAQPVPVPARQP